MNIIAGGGQILRHELEIQIRDALRLENKKLNFWQFEREVKKRLNKQMPSSQALY